MFTKIGELLHCDARNPAPSTAMHEGYLAAVQWNIEVKPGDRLKKHIAEMRPFCQLKKHQRVTKRRVKRHAWLPNP